jgi:hypothetical protein
MDIKSAIIELTKFSGQLFDHGEPIQEKEIWTFEERHKFRLPEDFKTMLRMFNGVALGGTEVYGISVGYSLEECYEFEHYEVGNQMPVYLVPFSPDGAGNHYCFDTRKKNKDSCLIVFWQHDYSYSDADTPEVTNDSFADWIKKEMIDWTLEYYDYEGNEK